MDTAGGAVPTEWRDEPPAGSPVRVRYTKWGGRRHWEWDATSLGGDEHGVWLAVEGGALVERPGARFFSETAWIVLVPRGEGWVAGFYHPDKDVATYVDMTTVPSWTQDEARWEVSMVDLDLDVVLTREGRLYVDDEDEFAQHQVVLDYPRDVVEHARLWCERVLEAVREGREPFVTGRARAAALGDRADR